MVNREFYIYLATILLVAIVSVASCTPGPVATTLPLTTILPATTTTTTAANTSQATITLTKTATLMTTTKTEINDEPIAYSVVDLYVPPYKPPNDVFPILIVVTNTEGSQVSCDIPIVFTNLSDSSNIVTYVINVIFDIGETKAILAEGISMKDGYYSVQVGQKTSQISIA